MANRHNLKVKDGTQELIAQFGLVSDTLSSMKRTHDDLATLGAAIQQTRVLMDTIRGAVIGSKSDDFVDSLIKRLEGLLALIYHWSTCDKLTQMIGPIVLYLQSWASESLTAKVMRMMHTILVDSPRPNGMEGQGGWFSSNWQKLVEGDFGHRLAGAINLLILTGFCPEKVSNKIGDEAFKALHVTALRKKSSSIFHYLFQTIDWVVDTVIPAFVSGDMSLLLSPNDFGELDDMYRNSLDMVHLNITGQMEKVKDKYGVTCEAELVVYLTKVSAAHMAAKSKATGGSPMQKELLSRLIKLDKLQGDVQAFWHSKGLRVKPYAVLIRGPSSVGKSTLAGICIHAISQANGFPEGQEFACTLNGSDKYQSEHRTCVISTVFDDFGNTRPEHAEGNPLFVLIQFINNMHCAALSPEAEKKGKNDIRSKIVVVTTNTEDLHSAIFSVNPASIMRRFDLVIDAELKPGCQSSEGSIHPRFAKYPQPDAWNLSLNRVKILRDENVTLADKWKTICFKQTDVIGLIDYLHDTTPDYFEVQESIVNASCDLHKREHCSKHPRFTTPCIACCKQEYESKLNNLHRENCDLPLVEDVYEMAQEMGDEDLKQGDALAEAWRSLDGQSGILFEHLLNPLDDFLCDYLSPDMLRKDPGLASDAEEPEWEPISPYRRILDICDHSHAWLKDLSRETIKWVRENPTYAAIGAIASVGLALCAFQKFTEPKKIEAEGAYLTKIQEAAKKPKEYVETDGKYQKVWSTMGPRPGASVSTTLSQLEARIDDNLYVAIFQEWDQRTCMPVGPERWGNMVPVGKGQWLLAAHFAPLDKDTLVSMKFHPNVGTKRFSAIINAKNAYQIPGQDVTVAHLPKGGDNADFSKYMFADAKEASYVKGSTVFVYHNHVSQVQPDVDEFNPPSSYKHVSKIRGIERRNVRGIGNFDLLTYDGPNHPGMCGSMAFLGEKNPVFLGIHTAGDEKNEDCGVSLVTRDMIIRPEDRIHITEAAPFPDKVLGQPISVTPFVHKFSPVHYVEDPDANFEAGGQHSLPTSKFRTNVQKSVLSEAMEKILHYEPTHGPPPNSGASVSRNRHFREVTAKRAPVNPRYLTVALDDFKAKLKPLVSNPKFKEMVHPISLKDACSGVEGVKGFDCLNPTTSPGFGFTGPKSKLMLQSGLEKILRMETFKYITENDGVYEFEVRFDPKKLDMDQSIEELLEAFKDEIRANVMFKCNLKDEALKMIKIEDNKIRIFAGAPVHVVTLARMATQSLLRTMSLYPEEFESAVGVDATGKDWEYIRNILATFPERCGDGDFKSYDTSMSPDFSEAAWSIVKFILRECDYNDDWIQVIDGIATECIFPWYETQGLIFKALGSNPSGHPLTVIINGLANSLYMRYAYYAMHDVENLSEIPLFHERVKLITYGDDNAFCINPEEDSFGMISVSEELGKIGVLYTGADKLKPTAQTKFVNDLSFLKRTFNKHPQLGVVGALEKDSIYKSLYMTRKVKGRRESDAQIAAMNLSGALRELYYHNREEYLEHYPKFWQIASKCVDLEGHRVIDHYDPPTEEQIIADFHATTCAYPIAQARLLPEMDGQAGILNQLSSFCTTVIGFVRDRDVAICSALEWCLSDYAPEVHQACLFIRRSIIQASEEITTGRSSTVEVVLALPVFGINVVLLLSITWTKVLIRHSRSVYHYIMARFRPQMEAQAGRRVRQPISLGRTMVVNGTRWHPLPVGDMGLNLSESPFEVRPIINQGLSIRRYVGSMTYHPWLMSRLHAFALHMFALDLEDMTPPQIVRGQIVFPVPKNIVDIWFRFFLVVNSATFGAPLAWDYRYRPGILPNGQMIDFSVLLKNCVADMRRKKEFREKIAVSVDNLNNCHKDWIVPAGDERAMYLVHRIRTGHFDYTTMRFESVVKIVPELEDYMRNFLMPDEKHKYFHVQGNLEMVPFVMARKFIPASRVVAVALAHCDYSTSKIYKRANWSDVITIQDLSGNAITVKRPVERIGFNDPIAVMLRDHQNNAHY